VFISILTYTPLHLVYSAFHSLYSYFYFYYSLPHPIVPLLDFCHWTNLIGSPKNNLPLYSRLAYVLLQLPLLYLYLTSYNSRG